jgi:hypothetical protein
VGALEFLVGVWACLHESKAGGYTIRCQTMCCLYFGHWVCVTPVTIASELLLCMNPGAWVSEVEPGARLTSSLLFYGPQYSLVLSECCDVLVSLFTCARKSETGAVMEEGPHSVLLRLLEWGEEADHDKHGRILKYSNEVRLMFSYDSRGDEASIIWGEGFPWKCDEITANPTTSYTRSPYTTLDKMSQCASVMKPTFDFPFPHYWPAGFLLPLLHLLLVVAACTKYQAWQVCLRCL